MFEKDFDFAKNNVSSRILFEGRKEYNRKVLSKEEDEITTIDIWNEKPYYGKIDDFGSAVFLSETNLKQIESERDTIFLTDFVADAFEDLRAFYKVALLQKKIRRDSILSSIEPNKGWKSVNTLYHDSMVGLYDSFVSFYIKFYNKERKITTFTDFIRYFLQFVESLGGDIPLTRTGLIYSFYCPANISGLVVEIATKNYGDDERKIRDFIEDPNFEYYKMSARKFGFRCDKNIPWRLVADITSYELQNYFSKYGISSAPGNVGDLFDIYYYRSYEFDIELLKEYLFQFYNSYVSAYPFVNKKMEAEDGKFLFQSHERKPISQEEYEIKYSNLFWLKTYLKIRVIETKIKWDENQLNIHTQKVLELYKNLDFSSALNYINRKTLPPLR